MTYMMSDSQYQATYNCLSANLASMMATTMFLWFRTAGADNYKGAVLITGLVTLIADYHYIHIFYSWVGAYHYSAEEVVGGAMSTSQDPSTGIPYNDAYRYMDGLLTCPCF